MKHLFDVMMKLQNGTGLREEEWYELQAIVGISDGINDQGAVWSDGGLYHIRKDHAKRLQRCLPFMVNRNDYIVLAEERMKTYCDRCKGICDSTEGHNFGKKGAACSHCYKEFCEWKTLQSYLDWKKGQWYNLDNYGGFADYDQCTKCKGIYHEATGHYFSDKERACGICAGKFWAWKLNNSGCPLVNRQKRKKLKKQRRQVKKEERNGRRLAAKIAVRNMGAASSWPL